MWWRSYERECAEWAASLSPEARRILFDDGIDVRLRVWR